MVKARMVRSVPILLAIAGLTGCASQGGLLESPAVNLTSVEVSEMNFDNQTFLLGFSVSNPNPIPLPVRSVAYQVRLNNQNFAGGETQSDFTIPAGGNEDIVISVDLDLLRSGAEITSIIRSGVKDNLNYEVHGNLGVDLPMEPSLSFSNTGTIMVQSELF